MQIGSWYTLFKALHEPYHNNSSHSESSDANGTFDYEPLGVQRCCRMFLSVDHIKNQCMHLRTILQAAHIPYLFFLFEVKASIIFFLMIMIKKKPIRNQWIGKAVVFKSYDNIKTKNIFSSSTGWTYNLWPLVLKLAISVENKLKASIIFNI